MRILAIETATSVCGCALVENGAIRREYSVEAPQIHSEKIMGLIDKVLASSQMACTDVDAVAVSIGPGSFTGLRIGLSVAKGLSFAGEKPLIAVSTLEALAGHAVLRDLVTADDLVLAAIDARRNEVFAAAYRTRTLEEVIAPRAVTLSALVHLLANDQNIEGLDVLQYFI